MPKPPSVVAAALKTRQEGAKDTTPPNAKDVTALAKELAGKPYGGVNEVEEKMKNVSISLPPAMIVKLQDAARANARAGGSELTNVSAIVRRALEKEGY